MQVCPVGIRGRRPRRRPIRISPGRRVHTKTRRARSGSQIIVGLALRRWRSYSGRMQRESVAALTTKARKSSARSSAPNRGSPRMSAALNKLPMETAYRPLRWQPRCGGPRRCVHRGKRLRTHQPPRAHLRVRYRHSWRPPLRLLARSGSGSSRVRTVCADRAYFEWECRNSDSVSPSSCR